MNNQIKKAAEKSELTKHELDTVSGGGQSQGDLKGALTKLEKEIKKRESTLK
jgi:bacteriocin-like protein